MLSKEDVLKQIDDVKADADKLRQLLGDGRRPVEPIAAARATVELAEIGARLRKLLEDVARSGRDRPSLFDVAVGSSSAGSSG